MDNQETKKFKFVGAEPVHFSVGEKEHYLSHGKRATLPPTEPYVAGLIASGQLVEVGAENATNETDNVAKAETAADTAPASKAHRAR